MKLRELGLYAFGRFDNQTLNLGPGLNLIYGQNEAGKSTIQKFVMGMLYGFKRPALHKEYLPDLDRYQPWGRDEYRGTLVYELDSGMSCRLEREFHPRRERVRIFDDRTGTELTEQFLLDRREERLFMEAQTGVPQAVFSNTAWIGQLLVNRLEMAHELFTRMANMRESGREDQSVRAALRMLDEAWLQLGTDGHSGRPFARISRAIGEREAEYKRALAARSQVLQWELDLREARGELGRAEQELAKAALQVDRCRLQELAQRLERGRRLARQAEEARAHERSLRVAQELPESLREQMLRQESAAHVARESLQRLAQRLAQLENQREALLERLAPLRRLQGMDAEALGRLNMLASSIRQAEAQLPGLQDEAGRVEGLIAELAGVSGPLAPVAAHRSGTVARLEELEKEMAQLRPRASLSRLDEVRRELVAAAKRLRKVGGWGLVAGGAILLLLGAGGAFGDALGLPLNSMLGLQTLPRLIVSAIAGVPGLALLGLGLVRRQQGSSLRREVADAEEELEELRLETEQAAAAMARLVAEQESVLHQAEVSSLTELQARIVRYEQLTAREDGQRVRLSALNSQIVHLQEQRQEMRQQLAGILASWQGVDPLHAEVDDDAQEHFRQSYLRFQELRGQWDLLTREVQELAQRQQEEQEVTRMAEQELWQLHTQAGVSSTDELDAALRHQEEWRRAAQEAETMERLIAERLGDLDLDALAFEVQQLQHRLTLAGEELDTATAFPDSRAAAAQVKACEETRDALRTRVAELAARVDTAYRELPDLGELTRGLHELRAEQAQLKEQAQLLQQTRELIEVVSGEIHREFAPRLNKALGRVVDQLTAGHYQQVKVDEQLRLRVLSQDGRLVEAAGLSAGTIDQLYFGLRFALIDLITDGTEPVPLILDDPFVQYDEHRLRAALEFLCAQSQRYQIILCTCHQRELRIARELSTPVPIHVVEI